MAKTVFFSWQVDTDATKDRNFIHSALEKACKNLALDAEVEEALRVDSDTKGVAGQPPIVETIYRKIDSCAIYVADMSFVGTRLDGRSVSNPNVLIEYGRALKGRDSAQIITVMNAAYGEPSANSLPFNMRHVLWPITYNLSPTATSDEKAQIKSELVKTLTSALRASMATLLPESAVSAPVFEPVQPKDGSARFRTKGESIGYDDGFSFDKAKEIFLQDGPEMWLRLMPIESTPRQWTIPELTAAREKQTSNLAPLISGSGYSFLRAEDGVGSYASNDRNTGYAFGVSFVFETGEVWGIDTALLSYAPDKLFQGDIEKNFSRALLNYADLLSQLGIEGPYRWIAGINGTKGRTLGYPPRPNHYWVSEIGPVCAASQIMAEGTYSKEQTPMEALMPFFNRMFEKCNRERPDYLPQR